MQQPTDQEHAEMLLDELEEDVRKLQALGFDIRIAERDNKPRVVIRVPNPDVFVSTMNELSLKDATTRESIEKLRGWITDDTTKTVAGK